jgi:hypothetical protein
VTSAADYVVTASNATGSTQATVNITVVSGLTPPSNLSYTTPVSYPTGYAITPNNPTVTGVVSTWAISPALPAGLSFNTSSGVISGTPTSVTSAANHTVTASNAAGSTQATVNITVTLGAPTNLSYSPSTIIGYVGTPIGPATPSNSGGAISSYSVSPALPPNLSLNTSTGEISGTPNATQGSTNYTVTGSNATGSTQATVTIIVY